jgi:hypothetical protein
MDSINSDLKINIVVLIIRMYCIDFLREHIWHIAFLIKEYLSGHEYSSTVYDQSGGMSEWLTY